MELISKQVFELTIAFSVSFMGTALASAVQNIYEGREVIPCLKLGAVQGMVFGLMACVGYILT